MSSKAPGRQQFSQAMMRGRVGFQAFTVVALMFSIGGTQYFGELFKDGFNNFKTEYFSSDKKES